MLLVAAATAAATAAAILLLLLLLLCSLRLLVPLTCCLLHVAAIDVACCSLHVYTPVSRNWAGGTDDAATTFVWDVFFAAVMFGLAVRNVSCLRRFILEIPNICQDRLGTSTGKVEGKDVPAGARARLVAARPGYRVCEYHHDSLFADCDGDGSQLPQRPRRLHVHLRSNRADGW